ncbi:hypothetical protein DPMN_053452 [Dreissena polymorpha]|uniref:Uncharacterized protein n=1 Tax=Dreissena polymorpha TaxID=45954 RepID=A0A9D4HS74_DREPO|nr:hypothetical protein DPMN_053452 [Dreissena polymorpha]
MRRFDIVERQSLWKLLGHNGVLEKISIIIWKCYKEWPAESFLADSSPTPSK